MDVMCAFLFLSFHHRDQRKQIHTQKPLGKNENGKKQNERRRKKQQHVFYGLESFGSVCFKFCQYESRSNLLLLFGFIFMVL